MRTLRLALLLALVLAGCSGGSANQPGNGTGEPSTEPEKTEQQRAEEKLDRYQAAACERVCPRLTECAIESARENMEPGEVTELRIEEIRTKHTEDCRARCIGGKMSLRQVEVFYNCPDEAQTCPELLSCLDQASPKR